MLQNKRVAGKTQIASISWLKFSNFSLLCNVDEIATIPIESMGQTLVNKLIDFHYGMRNKLSTRPLWDFYVHFLDDEEAFHYLFVDIYLFTSIFFCYSLLGLKVMSII